MGTPMFILPTTNHAIQIIHWIRDPVFLISVWTIVVLKIFKIRSLFMNLFLILVRFCWDFFLLCAAPHVIADAKHLGNLNNVISKISEKSIFCENIFSSFLYSSMSYFLLLPISGCWLDPKRRKNSIEFFSEVKLCKFGQDINQLRRKVLLWCWSCCWLLVWIRVFKHLLQLTRIGWNWYDLLHGRLK